LIKKKRLMKAVTVVKKWETAVDKLKKQLAEKCFKANITGRPKSMMISRASSRLAKTYAKMAGMKSMGEVKCAADLERRNIKFTYETTTVEYQHKVQHYTPDFDIGFEGSNGIHIEYKGKLDYETRKKLLAERATNPDMQIGIVFEKPNNKIMKGSKTTYGKWAETKGFLWADKTVPKEWL